jgi:hypothetical protein
VFRILRTSFGFGLASQGRSAGPQRLSGALQASGYDSKLKFTFFLLFVISGLDGIFVHTRRLGSGLLVSRRFPDARCGGAVSRDLV